MIRASATPDGEAEQAVERLEADGLIARDGDAITTTRRWQAAMARAALHLYGAGDPGHDLRVPIAHALIAIYGASVADEKLAALVEAMLPIEAAALGLGLTGTARSARSS